MDDTDRGLLRILTQDGRRSISDLASDLGVSRATVQNRIARMTDRGTIAKFTVEIGPDDEEAVISAFCLLKLIVEIRTHSLKKLDEILDDIRRVPDVAETVSSLRLAKVSR